MKQFFTRFRQYTSPILALGIALFIAYQSWGNDAPIPTNLPHPFTTLFISTLIPVILWITPILLEKRHPAQSLPPLSFKLFSFAFLTLFIGSFLLACITPSEEGQAILQLLQKLSFLERCVIALIICGLVPLCEEIVFRRILPDAFGFHAAAILFAIAHGVPALIFTFLFFAYALLYLRKYTGRIWPGIVLHCCFNLFNLLTV